MIRRIEAAGIAVTVETLGEGALDVLFVHGLGANRGTWHRAGDYFDRTRYRLIFPDLPGFGDSSRPEQYDYSMSSFGDCLHDVLVELESKQPHIVVHSMGCVVALCMIDRHGVSPRSFVAAEGNLVAEDAFMSSKVARLTEPAFVRSYSKWLNMVRASLGSEPNDQHDRFVESLRHASPVAVHRASSSCSALTRSGTMAQQFASLDCPRAVVFGAHTVQVRPLPSAASSPHVRRIEVPGQGHFMMAAADAFYCPIVEWLGSIDRSRSSEVMDVPGQ